MATDCSSTSAVRSDNSSSTIELPLRARFALEDMQRICSSMFALQLVSSGAPSPFEPGSWVFGACISLIGELGSWEVALFGDDQASSSLARVFFAMEPEQQPMPDEIVDAMGELINMVSGAVKTRLDQQEHERLVIGVPIFHTSHADCEKYQTKVIPLVSQRVISDQLEGVLCLVWSERTPVVLLQEARACLMQQGDKLALSNGLAALHELSEIVADSTAAENVAAIHDCQRALTDIINEQGQLSTQPIIATIEALIEALEEDFLLPLRRPDALADSRLEDGLSMTVVQRDAELLEMLGEFLSESQEGLEKCDELLLQIEAGQGNSDSIAALFRQFHTIKGIASFHGLVDVERLSHATESLLAEVRDGKRDLSGAAMDLVFESTAVLSRAMLAIRESVEKSLEFPGCRPAQALTAKLAALARGETVDTKGCGRHASNSPSADNQSHAVIKETVKVEVEQLNELDALLPDYRRVLGMLDASQEKPMDVATAFADLNELVHRTETLCAHMRMVPLRALFQKMTRMARDLAKKTAKLARLVLEGEDTRAERNIVEKLNGPLVHMIRNAIDHGLESEAIRRNLGKPLIGTIRLAARSTREHVIIEVSDDGKGLDADAIFAKALARGLLPNGQRPADRDLFQLIFEPGFSTAAQVTAISGRGVGMDVVRREIQALGGKIEIDSREGLGSSFRITLAQRQ